MITLQSNKKNPGFVCSRAIELLYDLIDVRQVPSLVVVVEAVSHDEVVLDVEASVVDFEVHLQASRLDEERGDEDFLRLLFAQHTEQGLHGSARFDDVFHDDHGSSDYVFIQSDELFHFAGAAGSPFY